MDKLNIWSNNDLVGTLHYDSQQSRFSLDYDSAWLQRGGFPLSPHLSAAQLTAADCHIKIRHFLNNLLPEGQALDDIVKVHNLSKSNLFGLINVIGRESAGALSFLPEGKSPSAFEPIKRPLTFTELSTRIRNRPDVPFSVWDGKVRMSIAGFQDKISVLKNQDGSLHLVEGSLSSTHILKPAPVNQPLKHLVLNEFYCMQLANAVGINAATVELLRVPEPVLLIERFDRIGGGDATNRIHVIDGCQALNLPPEFKYERNYGSGDDVSHIRDGSSLPKIFELISLTNNKMQERFKLLLWVIFNYVIGNTDAHGKNISYFIDKNSIRITPHYDLVAVEYLSTFDHNIGMAIGDEFIYDKVMAYDWAEFANVCNIPKIILIKEMQRLAAQTINCISTTMQDNVLINDEERLYMNGLENFIIGRATKLHEMSLLVKDIDVSI